MTETAAEACPSVEQSIFSAKLNTVHHINTNQGSCGQDDEESLDTDNETPEYSIEIVNKFTQQSSNLNQDGQSEVVSGLETSQLHVKEEDNLHGLSIYAVANEDVQQDEREIKPEDDSGYCEMEVEKQMVVAECEMMINDNCINNIKESECVDNSNRMMPKKGETSSENSVNSRKPVLPATKSDFASRNVEDNTHVSVSLYECTASEPGAESCENTGTVEQRLPLVNENEHRVANRIATKVASVPERSRKRVNPFDKNKIDEEEQEKLWQTNESPTNEENDCTSGNACTRNSNVDLQSQGIQTEMMMVDESCDSHPHFELMPKSAQRRYYKSDGSESCLSVEDVDAAIREIKLRNKNLSSDTDVSAVKPFEAESRSIPTEPNEIVYCDAVTSKATFEKGKELERTLPQQSKALAQSVVESVGPCEPADLIEGIIFTADYLGSTQIQSERNPGKNARMLQAQEAVCRIKAPKGDSQPRVEVDLFLSTDRVKILNAKTQETMMNHTLRSVSYIADIGNLLVIMAKRQVLRNKSHEKCKCNRDPNAQRSNQIVCHAFSSVDSHIMAQAIGQAFHVAYQQFLSANGIEPQCLTKDDYSELLDVQEMYHDDLMHYSKKENIKDIWVEKKKGELLGITLVESGWGSIVPTVILANLQHRGPAERCGKLSIGDQIMTVNGTSLVGLPITACQSVFKGLRAQTIARLNIVSCPPVVTVLIKRPDLKYQLGFSVQEGIICSLLRGGIAEKGGIRVGHRIIEINGQSVVAIHHERMVEMLVASFGEIRMKTMPAMMYRLLTGQENPIYI